jgi:hypothetical protein
MISRLQIEPQYLDPKNHSLVFAYAKYKTFLQASQRFAGLKDNQSWTGGGKKEDLMEIFASSSFFYSHYAKLFPLVENYPELVAWLENGDDRPSAIDAWGFERASYTFTDLKKFLVNQGEDIDNKKGKHKDKKKLEEKEDKRTNKTKGKMKQVESSEEDEEPKKSKGKEKRKEKSKGNRK